MNDPSYFTMLYFLPTSNGYNSMQLETENDVI